MLLIDEVDRVELETEALLLEVLSEYQVSIPELGTVRARQIPMVFLTSNNTRELSEALKRRCLFLHVDYPDIEREREIVQTGCPGSPTELADQVARIVRSIRDAGAAQGAVGLRDDRLGPHPGGARARRRSTRTRPGETLHVLLKYQTDIERATKELLAGHATLRELAVLDILTGFVAELRQPRAARLDDRAPRRRRGDRAHRPGGPRGASSRRCAATLVKSEGHWRGLRHWPSRSTSPIGGAGATARATASGGRRPSARARGGPGRQGRPRRAAASEGMSPEELAEMLVKALRATTPRSCARWRREAVDRYAGMEPGRPVGGTYYLYRTLRNLDLDGCWSACMARRRPGRRAVSRPSSTSAWPATSSGRASRGSRGRSRPRSAAAWSRTAGAEALARSVRKPLPEDIDVMHATREELAALAAGAPARSAASWPCAWPASAATGAGARWTSGPPCGARCRPAACRSSRASSTPARPSPRSWSSPTSRARWPSFARFTLHLVYAISSQFSKVRAFVFVDGIDEVTRLFERPTTRSRPSTRINAEADVIWIDGHSDYGHALSELPRALGRGDHAAAPRVLILGDARNNYHASEAWVVADMQARARHVYWLNPEPVAPTGARATRSWASTARTATRWWRCRTLRQLEKFVGELA